MFAALGPFLIDWYGFSAGQVMFLAAMEPLGAMALSIPLGVAADRYGGRIVMTALMFVLSLVLLAGLVVESYFAFLLMGVMLAPPRPGTRSPVRARRSASSRSVMSGSSSAWCSSRCS